MKHIVFLLSCLWLLADSATAAPTVSISPVSDGVYVLQGSDFSGISGVDLTIRYDPSALSNPRVAQGSLVGGSLIAANMTTPGLARVALVRAVEINGSGTIATIRFTRLKKSGDEIQSLSASVLSGSGKTTPAGTDVANTVADSEPDAGSQTAAVASSGNAEASASSPAATRTSSSSSSASSPVTAAAPGVLLVPVPLPAERTDVKTPSAQAEPGAEEAAGAETERSAAAEQVQVARAEAPTLKAPEPEKKKVMAYQSVLDRFREYKGKKTPQALTALFATGAAEQRPSVILSDGRATVDVLLELDSHGKNNNFNLEGVTLVSLRNKDQNHWIAELLPDKHVWQASITVPGDQQLRVIPLTVAPRLERKLTESDFRRFLSERGTDKAPRFDLNKDGKRDYVDDYIFTANYIAQQKEKNTRKNGK